MPRFQIPAFVAGLAIALGFVSGMTLVSSKAEAAATVRHNHRTLKGEARAKEIARKVDLLADMAYGINVRTLQPGLGEDLILTLVAEQNGYTSIKEYLEVETFHRNLKIKDISFGDMVGWGTMQVDAAKYLFASNDDAQSSKETRRAGLGQVVLQELSEMSGVSFGFTDGSSGYCGVSFMGLIIVDEENGVVYELSLTNSGPC